MAGIKRKSVYGYEARFGIRYAIRASSNTNYMAELRNGLRYRLTIDRES